MGGNRKVDIFTAEIIKHKLTRAPEEGALALELVSGSPVAAEAHDYMIALFRANGDLLEGGPVGAGNAALTGHAVRNILDHFGDDPGIFEGDVYLVNDPYAGAEHTPDVCMIAPCYFEGRLIAFSAVYTHVTDIGAMNPGGFCPTATECYQEGFASRGLKLVERGKLRKDVFETILNMVREPGMVALDFKSVLVASTVTRDRLIEIYKDYGFETVSAVFQQMIDETERLFKTRVMELPDGVFRVRRYLDYTDTSGHHAYPVDLALMKEGDTLTFDFTGTHEQLTIGFNQTYMQTISGLASPLFTLLCPDLHWNQGIIDCIKLIAPEGTMVNARRPAPVCLNSVGTEEAVVGLATLAISKMLGASEKYKNYATAIWRATEAATSNYGLDRNGDYFQGFAMDGFAAAGGARAFKDGADNGGTLGSLTSRVPNIEFNELYFPFRYLYKRVVPDSGGPGKCRGGICDEWAFTPHGSPNNAFSVICFPGACVDYPGANGLFGGYPGCNADYIEFRDSNAPDFPYNLGSTRGKQDHITIGATDIVGTDIMYNRPCGGGGYGDPIDRDPELVLKDVVLGLVTDGPAQGIYGVIIDHKNRKVDIEATHKQRLTIRKERFGGKQPKVETTERANIPSTGMRINEYLQVSGSGEETFVQCTWCGERICPSAVNWKDNVMKRKVSPTKSGPLRRDSGLYFMWEFFCPSCATQLDVDIVYKDDPPSYDRIYRWPE